MLISSKFGFVIYSWNKLYRNTLMICATLLITHIYEVILSESDFVLSDKYRKMYCMVIIQDE